MQGCHTRLSNTQLIAVRRLAAEAADNGMLDPTLAAAIGRVKGLKVQGLRSGKTAGGTTGGIRLRTAARQCGKISC